MSDIKQSDNAEKLYDMLIDKSKESFMMAIEVYNKPTYYKYSLQALEFLVDEISKDPNNIFDSIKKDNPRGKGMLSD